MPDCPLKEAVGTHDESFENRLTLQYCCFHVISTAYALLLNSLPNTHVAQSIPSVEPRTEVFQGPYSLKGEVHGNDCAALMYLSSAELSTL